MTELTAVESALVGRYDFDTTHSRMGFVARHAMITKVRGSFSDFEGHVEIAGDLARSTVAVVVKSASITTGNEMRDSHLRTNDFLDVTEFPEITFVSTELSVGSGSVEGGDLEITLTGDLTIKGVTRTSTLALTYTGSAIDPYGNHRIGFEGRGSLNRSDFGVTWNGALEAGGVLVGEVVTLEFDVSAIRAVEVAS
jgi:polyisoprenoid-binding protein YceI